MSVDDRFDCAWPAQAVLGEGLQWHGGRWWWTDIESACLHAWRPGEATAARFVMPDRLGCFAHTRSGGVLLGLAKRLALAERHADLGPQRLQTLAVVDACEARTRVNDGRTDREGFFVFGTLNESAERRPIGSFFQFSLQHGLRRLALPAVAIANSICFSLDGRTMYFCDTSAQAILQCDYHAAGAEVANVRLFAAMDHRGAWPDGSVVDRDGCLWNAQWGAGRVVRYSPEGRVMQVINAAASQLTCPAFGGPGLDTLGVASATFGLGAEALARQPSSGGLFVCRLARALGVPDTLFDDVGAEQGLARLSDATSAQRA